MRVSQAFPSNYLKAADLQGRNVPVTMNRVEMEDIGGDHKPVLYFNGKDKGVVLNKTNANNIAQLYGDDTDNWIGQDVVLFSAWVDFQGKSVEAIRIRGPQRQPQGRQAQTAQAPLRQPQKANGNGGGGETPPQGHHADLDDTIPFATPWGTF